MTDQTQTSDRDGGETAQQDPHHGFSKNPHERLLDAQLHLRMAKEGPSSKIGERIEKAQEELEVFIP